MGVPKFFRYISERYPCLSEKLKEYQIPEFDNLYLDMNGIIHNCSHPNDTDVSFRITEETIFKNIFHYIEILFLIIKPQKLFFMAVDGVAPRAKINQQRGRRFKAAKEAEVAEAKAKAKGLEIPKEARFDSNCITPGTVFMDKLNQQLKYFITYKISTDKLWQKCKIILSGSEVPGEGEHKIMDYIRYMKAQPGYDVHTRHCLYGLDADLIMLILCSHEPHFSLLREEVKFGKVQKKILTPEETNFCLLHVSLLREYLEHEFSPIKDKLSFEFDIEKIIDDWILMGFLVGNDFIPHLPNLHIEHGALPILYKVYMEVLPTLSGYINEAGTLNLERFEKFMEKLGHNDLQQFDDNYADLKYFEGKLGRKLNENQRNSKNSPNESPKKSVNAALGALIMATEAELGDSEESDSDEDSEECDVDMQLEFVQHKRDYYMNKMEYANVDANIMRSQAEGYITAIQWNLHYYYNGCCSWSWYYPHHYAPFVSDIKNFKDLKIEFDMGKPFLPFQQLLAVLPAASKALLPKAYHGLMTEEDSPIIKYYPLDFKTDLNGKKQEWEAVVLIPLIDEKSLLSAMEPCNNLLTPDERRRNQHGPMSIFTYSEKQLGMYNAPEYFPNIESYAKQELVNREDIIVPQDKLVKGLHKGVRLDVYYPGFPTLKHIPHTSCLVKAKVKVFEQPSRYENMILTVLPKPSPPIEKIAEQLLGQSVFIGWPHLIEALVVGLVNSKKRISISQKSQATEGNINFNTEPANDLLISSWNVHRQSIMETYKGRLGIDVGDIEVVVYACPIVGRSYVYGANGKMTLEKQWNENAMPFAYQVVLHNIAICDNNFIQFTSITDIFKPKAICFMLGHPHYGAMGEVVEPGVDLKTSRIKVAMRVVPEPNFDRLRKLQAKTKLRYMPGNIAAQRLGISSHLLSRITGTILVVNRNGSEAVRVSKQNIGLNLKFNKKNQEVPGYTRKDDSGWLYSVKAIDLIRSYMQKFPELFERLKKNLLSSDKFIKDELFPDPNSNALETTIAWLKEQQKLLDITPRPSGIDELETEVVQGIEKEVDETPRPSGKTVLMQVKPHLLYKPGLNVGRLAPDPKAQHRLFDRIVCVAESFTVPMGYKGTIIGIQKTDDPSTSICEIIFDKPFAGGLQFHGCSANRGYRMTPMEFINISYGLQIENKNSNKPNIAPQLNWRQQQSPNSQPSTPPLNWQQQLQRQQHQQQQHHYQQQQSPDPAALNCFYPAFGKPSQNGGKRPQQPQPRGPGSKPAFAESPNHTRRPKETTKFPQPPILLQRQHEPGRKPQVPPSAPAQNCNQPKPQNQAPSEFQALWNELYNIQKPAASPTKKQPAPVKSRPNPPPSATKESPQDPSAFLKAILKISDENAPGSAPAPAAAAPPASKPLAFPQSAKATDNTPPLVQQMFDYAREAELQSGKSIWYGSQLLSHYQLLGVGFPRYVYCKNKEDMVCATIILPDTRTFYGDFCRTHAEAAENTAKKVYEELKLFKGPQQWFNNNRNAPLHPRVGPPCPPPQQPHPPQPPLGPSQPLPPSQQYQPAQPNVAKPVLPAAFPQVPLMQIPMPKWSPLVQQEPHGDFAPPQPPNKHWFPQPQFPGSQEAPRKPTPFVPLQAQKKRRKPELGAADQPRPQQQQQQRPQSHDAKGKPESKPKANAFVEPKKEALNSNTKSEESVTQSNQLQNAQKTQKTERQRRSRVAARFNKTPV